jgi:hypothetical protein
MYLLEIMCDVGIPGKLIRLFKASMKNTETKVKFQTQLAEPFKIRQGFKQDDALAPALFNLAREYVIMKV